MTRRKLNRDDCLRCDPWEGGKGDDIYVLLSDRMVVAAQQHPHCQICHGPIAKGERHRARREVADRTAMTFRFCGLCCDAMARRHDDNGESLDARYGMHPALAHLSAIPSQK